jgi:hypothetical protein
MLKVMPLFPAMNILDSGLKETTRREDREYCVYEFYPYPDRAGVIELQGNPP